jgi:hypothetical protein
MGVGGVACINVGTYLLHGRCLDANDGLADGDGQFEAALEQNKDAEFWVLVNGRNGICGGALPDHKSAIAEVEFSDCASHVEL